VRRGIVCAPGRRQRAARHALLPRRRSTAASAASSSRCSRSRDCCSSREA